MNRGHWKRQVKWRWLVPFFIQQNWRCNVVKRWFAVGVTLLACVLVVGCGGIPQGDYDAVVADMEATKAEAASLQSQLDRVQSDLAAAESDLAAARSELAGVQEDIEAARSAKAAAQSEVSSLQSEMSTLQSQTASLESEISSLESDVAAAQDEIDALVVARDLALYAALPTTGVEVIYNIEYGKVGAISLRLDMYIPETPITTPMPAVIYIHGGSWKFLDKSVGSSNARYLATHGFLAVSIDYRLSGAATFPAAVEDCKCAVRWLRANAEEYNVDPDRIGVWGGSAGGHLSMMVGCADETAGLEGDGGWAEFSSRVQAVCSFYGLGDLAIIYREWGVVETNGVIAEFLGGTYQEIPEIYEAASPTNYVTADDPPLLLVHGELDQVVDIICSEVIYEAYQETGLEVTLIRVSGADHSFDRYPSSSYSPSIAEIEQMVLEFFIKYLLLDW